MVVSPAAYVYASVRTEGHELDGGFALLPFIADPVVAGAIVPSVPFGA